MTDSTTQHRQKHMVMRAPETRPSEWQSERAFTRISCMCITAKPVACQPHNLVLLYIHVHRQSKLPEVTRSNSKRSPLFRRADCWSSDWTAVSYVRLCVLDLPSFFFQTVDKHNMQAHHPSPPHCQHRVSALSTHDLCKSVHGTEQH